MPNTAWRTPVTHQLLGIGFRLVELLAGERSTEAPTQASKEFASFLSPLPKEKEDDWLDAHLKLLTQHQLMLL